MDRNCINDVRCIVECLSLSARRAWIEIRRCKTWRCASLVALRKESVDRNMCQALNYLVFVASLSARRAGIEIGRTSTTARPSPVALRKESVDRNMTWGAKKYATTYVALRKESVDRNTENAVLFLMTKVALRKESVDRNILPPEETSSVKVSLSARRAWIEIALLVNGGGLLSVALRKESVDRNYIIKVTRYTPAAVALRKESVDRNNTYHRIFGEGE